MATTGESKSENEEFLGFDEEAQVAVFQPREEEYLPSGLESDISVSLVPTEAIGLVQERRRRQCCWWKDNNHLVEVSPFTTATGPTQGVAEDGTAIDFFYLMFSEDLIEHIVSETN